MAECRSLIGATLKHEVPVVSVALLVRLSRVDTVEIERTMIDTGELVIDDRWWSKRRS